MKVRDTSPSARTFSLDLNEREAQDIYRKIGDLPNLGGLVDLFDALYDAGFRLS